MNSNEAKPRALVRLILGIIPIHNLRTVIATPAASNSLVFRSHMPKILNHRLRLKVFRLLVIGSTRVYSKMTQLCTIRFSNFIRLPTKFKDIGGIQRSFRIVKPQNIIIVLFY